jgi:hypothetical protein
VFVFVEPVPPPKDEVCVMSDRHEQRKKSLELFKALQRHDRSNRERLRLFTYLLALSFGFWQYENDTTPQTLRTWILRVAKKFKSTAIRLGARCDAMDDQGLAVSAKHVVHPERSGKNGSCQATHSVSEETPDEAPS